MMSEAYSEAIEHAKTNRPEIGTYVKLADRSELEKYRIVSIEGETAMIERKTAVIKGEAAVIVQKTVPLANLVNADLVETLIYEKTNEAALDHLNEEKN